MKFTLSWLKEYLDTDVSFDVILEKLTAIGLEVEGVEDPAKTLEGFVVGEIISAEKHPDADRLQCLIVDTGKEKLKVVCGAPNAKAGLKGIFASSGKYIPGLEVTLKKTKIRGEESNGMMCSMSELLISDEHDGIIELGNELKTGMPAAEALGFNDPIIDIALTPNRGDCAGVFGIARDLAAAGIGKLKPLSVEKKSRDFKNPIEVKLEDKKSCPLFIGCYIKGVKNEPSPQWLQNKLKSIGQNPISTLVDITNYLTFALNRPLHVYDADKLKGNIHVRFAKNGENFEALDDNNYKLTNDMAVICDDNGVLGLGGIIGGKATSVDENTKNIYLECAYFEPAVIARTGQKLQIDSDARYRYERGIDPAFTFDGAEIAIGLILDLCGGVASESFIAGEVIEYNNIVKYSPDMVATLGGCDVDHKKQKEILENLGFSVSDSDKIWSIKVPSWRHDVSISQDIVEEVLRIEGYDKIEPISMERAGIKKNEVLTQLQKRNEAARGILASRGMLETVTWSFIDSDKADIFGANDNGHKDSLTLVNPISADMSVMRPSLLPSLIDAAVKNANHGYPNMVLFELGGVYKTPHHDGQASVVSGIRAGNAELRHWANKERQVDAIDVKADVFAVIEACGFNPDNMQITTDAPNWYHPGRSGSIKMGRNVIAHFGEIHPRVLNKFKSSETCMGFEVFVNAMPATKNKGTHKQLLKPSQFQPLLRDFAFLVNADVPADKFIRAIKTVDKKLITNVEIFDIYTGKGIDEGKKSVALGVTLQPTEKTMTDKDISIVSEKIVKVVKEKIGGSLRG